MDMLPPSKERFDSPKYVCDAYYFLKKSHCLYKQIRDEETLGRIHELWVGKIYFFLNINLNLQKHRHISWQLKKINSEKLLLNNHSVRKGTLILRGNCNQ